MPTDSGAGSVTVCRSWCRCTQDPRLAAAKRAAWAPPAGRSITRMEPHGAARSRSPMLMRNRAQQPQFATWSTMGTSAADSSDRYATSAKTAYATPAESADPASPPPPPRHDAALEASREAGMSSAMKHHASGRRERHVYEPTRGTSCAFDHGEAHAS